MEIFIIIALVLLFVFEFSCFLTYNTNRIIKGKRIDVLISELSNATLNTHSKNILSLTDITNNGCWYISTIPFSLFFSYYMETHHSSYSVVRFSRAHYLIKKKLKQVKENYKSPIIPIK